MSPRLQAVLLSLFLLAACSDNTPTPDETPKANVVTPVWPEDTELPANVERLLEEDPKSITVTLRRLSGCDLSPFIWIKVQGNGKVIRQTSASLSWHPTKASTEEIRSLLRRIYQIRFFDLDHPTGERAFDSQLESEWITVQLGRRTHRFGGNTSTSPLAAPLLASGSIGLELLADEILRVAKFNEWCPEEHRREPLAEDYRSQIDTIEELVLKESSEHKLSLHTRRLRYASGRDYGRDIEAWRRWWRYAFEE